LEAIYSFHNPDEIKRFLSSHDFFIQYLFEAYDQIRRFFGGHIDCNLKLILKEGNFKQLTNLKP